MIGKKLIGLKNKNMNDNNEEVKDNIPEEPKVGEENNEQNDNHE